MAEIQLVLFSQTGVESATQYTFELVGLGVFLETGGLRLSGLTTAVKSAMTTSVTTVQLELDDKQPLSLYIPANLLVLDGERYRFRKGDEFADKDEWAALKDRVRRRLASPIEANVGAGSATGLFGVKAIGEAELKARIFLNPALVDGVINDQDWVLRAEASADVSLTYLNVNAKGLDLTGRLLATVLVRKAAFKDWVAWDEIGFDMPYLPGFNLRLPKIAFGTSWLDGAILHLPSVDLDFLDAPSLFCLALPPFVDKLDFKWAPAPKLAVTFVNGTLLLSTSVAGAGTFNVDGQAWVNVTNVSLSLADAKFTLTSELDCKTPPISVPDKEFSPPLSPFTIRLAGSTLTPSFNNIDIGGGEVLANASLSINFKGDRVVVAAKEDPSILIAFAIEVDVSYDPGSRKTKATLKALSIVEPYPIELIRLTGDVLGELIRLIAAVPVPKPTASKPQMDGFFALLERIGQLLATAGKWLAKQAGNAAEALAGLVEAVFDGLMQLGRKLAQLGGDAVSHIAVEVRLDPKTYQLRQIVVMPAGKDADLLTKTLSLSALGFDFDLDAALRPSLIIDLGPSSWVGLVIQPTADSHAVLGTDLWLDKETTPQQAMGSTDETGKEHGQRLIQLKASPSTEASGNRVQEIVVAAVQRGRPRFFQTFEDGKNFTELLDFKDGNVAASLRETGVLKDAGVRLTTPAGQTVVGNPVIDITFEAQAFKNRLLSLLTSANPAAQKSDFLDKLKQKVEVTGVSYKAGSDRFSIEVKLEVTVHIDDNFAPQTDLIISASLRDLSMRITGGDKIYINSKPGQQTASYQPLGLDLTILPIDPTKDPYKQFFIDLSRGGESLGLADEAKALLSYGKVSSAGKGLQFDVSTFRIGRSGFDLEAAILPEPVRLGGVDMPFRFTSGQVTIKGSKFGGGALTGTGQLPQALVGEANATVALQLGAGGDGDVIVKGATARLDKAGDPIRCNATRFELTITELGFDFVNAGSYHFYFLLTGSAVFKPGNSEYTSGLLKNFKDITIKLDKAPLAADPRVLMSAISFQVKVDPPKKISLFDVFDFELRGFGYHPAVPKFDGAPGMSVSGQARLTPFDKDGLGVEFHSMLIGLPIEGSAMPRVRFDGLTVGLKTGAVNVEATAIAVDGSMPDLYDPGVLPKDVTAQGFLASGKLDIDGWASMSGAMGFLELRKKNDPSSRPKYSFFIYGQEEKLAEPIDTPVGQIYLREFGFGFGYKYTLAGIAQAETATSPQQLTQMLDDVSKYQGNLATFKAWQPTYENDGLTLALRGMFALSAATQGSAEYRPKEEAGLPNPLLFDIVAAFRTDFTFLINLRAWLSVNYNDWVSSGLNESWKSMPTMRGYLYFSVPRKEFLGRFIADGSGYVGEHPKLPEQLVKAIRATKFSATLYIRPGLFHAELGWPYELSFTLGAPNDKFYLDLKGGLIHRIEDLSVLNGIAFKAQGSVYLEGRVGGSSLGAAAVARANFAIEARVLSYLSLKDIGDSFYYGYMRIDVSVGVGVEVWLSFSVFGGRITLSASFSLTLAVSIALEAVIGPSLLGGRADVSIGVRAFGRSLSVRIALSFNNDKLAIARAKVARFMDMGLAAPIPDKTRDGQRIEKNPQPDPPRGETAGQGDAAIEDQIGAEPLPPVAQDQFAKGRPIGPSDFWAILYPTREPTFSADLAGDGDDVGEWFVMLLLPRDHTRIGPDPEITTPEEKARENARATFYASPRTPVKGFDAPGHKLIFNADIPTPKGTPHLYRIPVNTGITDGDIAANGEYTSYYTQLGTVVAREEGGGRELPLGKLLQSLFAGKPDEASYGGDLTEPAVRSVDVSLTAIDPDAKASASQLDKAGRSRSNLSGYQRREAEIEDTRSAVLSSLTETAASLAATGADANGVWPDRLSQIDARDFGLTFIVNRSALGMLFDLESAAITPPAARFVIVKSDVASGGGYDHNGRVALFNPPARMFREAQPKFTPTSTIDAQGIKLNWDLEPAWGASQGAYDDPEFHLKHYRIRRTVRGIPGKEFRADFLVKAGSAIKYQIGIDESGETTTKVSFLRPDFQFVDSLRIQDDGSAASTAETIPDLLRKLLLGEATAIEWGKEYLGVKDVDVTRVINLLYEVVPVDNAGTSDFGLAYVVDGFGLVDTAPISPSEVTLQVSYPAMPSHIAAPGGATAAPSAKLCFLLKPGMKQEKQGQEIVLRPQSPDEVVYLLRIAPQPIAPSGGYGSDAVDEARRQPDQDAINRLSPTEIQQFYLQMKEVKRSEDYALVAEYLEGGKEEPVIRYFAATAYRAPEGPTELPKKTDSVSALGDLAKAINAVNAQAPDRLGYRLFLASVDLREAGSNKIAVDPAVRGEWRTAAFNIAIAGSDETTAISSVVEVLEQPVHYEFKALQRSDMRAESGRLIIIHPGVASTIGKIGYAGVRDAARRTAARLEWNANPASLALTIGAAGVDNRTIGGFDLFCVDPDALPGRDETVVGEVVSAARRMGRVALLPAEMDGLDPSGFGDFGRIESAYPSETLRLLHGEKMKGASGLSKAGWYSGADTTAIFPEPAIRRSIMPDPDEGLIAALFAGGKPDVIRVSIPSWLADDRKIPALDGWTISIGGALKDATGWDEYTDQASAPVAVPGPDPRGWSVSYSLAEGGAMSVPKLRRLLQNLRLSPGDNPAQAVGREKEVLGLRMSQPDFMSSIGVLIEALRVGRDGQLLVVASQEHSFDPMPATHPILADALAFLQYDSQDDNGLKNADGKIYRRFAVAPDSSPQITSKDFLAYLDEVPPERDPYGWGALRTLGLAAGFRLYDTDTGDYVRFGTGLEGLEKRVQLAFERALERYGDEGARDNGQPFFDLLTQPWGNVKLEWFDGGDLSVSSGEADQVREEMLAVAQIALRPRPDRLLPAKIADADEETAVKNLAVAYYALVIDANQPIASKPWGITQRDETFENVRYDVLSVVRTVTTQKPMRLSKDASYFEFHEPAKAIDWPETGMRLIAIVREIRIAAPGPDAPLLDILPPEGAAIGTDEPWKRVVQPAVLNALAESGVPGEEFCFGRFERLIAADWGDALFSGTESNIAVHQALDRLAHYAGRRFAPLVFPVSSGADETDAKQLRSDMANRFVAFWGRFLDHCTPAWGKVASGALTPAQPLSVFLSLGTVADPGQWRRAPGSTGTVSVTMVDADRRGARRKFAIRPYGRYEAWASAAPDKLDVTGKKKFPWTGPTDLKGALGDVAAEAIGRTYFVDVTLPRTEPLEKPVILSSVTHQPSKSAPGRMELVIAHSSDVVLAEANRRNAALLAPLDISVGFWREFANMPWLRSLESKHELTLQPMDQLGTLDGPIDSTSLAITRDTADERLTDLRKRVPDAWLGSTMISAMNLPYFFRVHALVHATAGVVVSEQVATTFEEGFFKLGWPYAADGYKYRELSRQHRYSVSRRPTEPPPEPEKDPAKRISEVTIVTFDLAAIRFVDCMVVAEAETWFGKDGSLWSTAFKAVAHLPEPSVSYRILVETSFKVTSSDAGSKEVLARTSEIDVLPNPPAQMTADDLYLLQQSGARFVPGLGYDEEGNPIDPTPVYTATPVPTGKDKITWRIAVPVRLAREPAPVTLTLDMGLAMALQDALKLLPAPVAGTSPAVAGLQNLPVEWRSLPTDMQWTGLIDALVARSDCPEAVGLAGAASQQTLPTQGVLMLPVPPEALEDPNVAAALKSITGVDPAPAMPDLLVLRRPPTDMELNAFADSGGKASGLRDKVYDLAEEQLFGPGRQPALAASKGAQVLPSDAFVSRKEASTWLT
ncbi:hypothetical protein [Rhizobium sp. CCGE531]|uniref:hypothetical protein n=1 Tax=Rhizobium sp. CCGE531 TaxID=2364271 RepID=UPI000EA9EB49|nr:hypothetical protein [Rhizobium sp. CCGE531]AYG66119.1 hypothetical protein CCGE531_09055 [Rhizobium sp. CCGE531]